MIGGQRIGCTELAVTQPTFVGNGAPHMKRPLPGIVAIASRASCLCIETGMTHHTVLLPIGQQQLLGMTTPKATTCAATNIHMLRWLRELVDCVTILGNGIHQDQLAAVELLAYNADASNPSHSCGVCTR